MWNLLCDTLTPYERYEAMRRLNNGDIDWRSLLTNKATVMLGWSVIMILLVVLAVIRRNRWEKDRQESAQRFREMAEQHKLSSEEFEILEQVAFRCRLKRQEAIFTLPEVFESGLSKLMQERFSAEGSAEDRKKLNETVFSLKGKLGFVKSAASFGAYNKNSRELNSRQISVGSKMSLALKSAPEGERLEVTVAGNDEYQITAEFAEPVSCAPGDVWDVRYEMGSMTWEFEAITMTCEGGRLELNHSDQIRCGNRRRFGRISVSRPALVALFDVMRNGQSPEAPEFVPAEITEISGPGLRVRAGLEVEVHDRLLVVFKADDGMVIQDIAEVRGLRDEDAGASIALELVGLNERAINELVRLTNSQAGQADAESEPELKPEPVIEGADK